MSRRHFTVATAVAIPCTNCKMIFLFISSNFPWWLLLWLLMTDDIKIAIFFFGSFVIPLSHAYTLSFYRSSSSSSSLVLSYFVEFSLLLFCYITLSSPDQTTDRWNSISCCCFFCDHKTASQLSTIHFTNKLDKFAALFFH